MLAPSCSALPVVFVLVRREFVQIDVIVDVIRARLRAGVRAYRLGWAYHVWARLLAQLAGSAARPHLVVLSFSNKLDPSAAFRNWLRVDGLQVQSASYDPATYSVIYDFVGGFEAGGVIDVVRNHVRCAPALDRTHTSNRAVTRTREAAHSEPIPTLPDRAGGRQSGCIGLM